VLNDIGIPTAFVAGIISFLSPCVLPLVPGYVSYVSGNTLSANGRSITTRFFALGLGLCFVLGFSSVFVALGATATALSRLLLYHRYEANLVGGAIIIAFGIFMTGLIPMPWLHRDTRFHGKIRGGRPAGADLLGLAFGFGWTPCIGPVLGAILTVSSVSSTATTGVVLLSVYAVGLGLPFLLATVFTDFLLRRRREVGRLGRLLQAGAGGVMVVMGVAMITGTMSVFSFWLLENLPVLQTIG
jgi:cytochrome c-type biogenesis protein